jgi:O-acetyl-ADP-ribose deacetylase (regulator of RNase III)
MFKKLVLSIIIGICTTAHAVTINLTPKVSLTIEQGDITKKKVDAIVNAANEELMGGAGVCGAIFKAAGWDELQAACNRYSFCPTGQARITPSFNLSKIGIKNIIHAVGPDCRIIKDSKQQDKLLYDAYYNSLKLADQNNITSIAFPFISSGIYAFPRERAARIALQAVKEYAEQNSNTTHLTHICFILFSDSDTQLFTDTAKAMFK